MIGGAVDEDPGFGAFMDRLCVFDKPLIAAVNGVGVGIGLTLLLHCDVVYIAEGARLRPPFVTLGVVPEAASSYLLPAMIGWQRAAEVLFTADWIDAARAVELGIASRIVARPTSCCPRRAPWRRASRRSRRRRSGTPSACCWRPAPIRSRPRARARIRPSSSASARRRTSKR